jgi:cellulose synthase/poly-beta-1,6-N-acetylglucosamine synthase-like glycosyltransferase
MTALLVFFVAASVALWLSVCGYLLMLGTLARVRGRARAPVANWPATALIVPTLNEEATIEGKLADLRHTDYPADRLRIVIIDGGSNDRTVARVRAAMAAGARIELWEIAARGSKAAQVNHAIERLEEPFIVATDADARLAPSCVRELIGTLLDDPRAAIVGASIRVATALPEERVHWWALNRLWWLEGEALSAAIVSGVCYAVRRGAVLRVAQDAHAEDVHLSLRSAGHGLRVRISPSAWATEIRVPRDAAELVCFRRRRGTSYLRELERGLPRWTPLGSRIARWVRLFHFRATPIVATGTALSAIPLLWSPYWRWPLGAALAFLLPVAALIMGCRSLREIGSPAQLVLIAGRWLGLLWFSLLVLLVRRGDRVASWRVARTVAHPSVPFPSADPEVGR